MRIYDLLNSINALDDQILEGDAFYLEVGDLLIETTVAKVLPEGVIIHADDVALSYLTLENDEQTKNSFTDLEIAIMEGGGSLDEAEYQGRKVPLGKPMRGDTKKSKVYVRKPNGKVVKVNFGDKKLSIKKHIPGRRKNFRARHNCDNPGPRWKARYWSCRAWE
jgi:hypothetical protein